MSLQHIIFVLSLASCVAPPLQSAANGASGNRVAPEPTADRAGTKAASSRPGGAMPGKTGTSLARGLELLRSGDIRQADPLLREELAEGSGFKEAAMALASFYRRREDHVEAETILIAALNRDPKSVELALMHARVLSETNRWQEAAEVLQAMLPSKPKSIPLRIALVSVERALGHLDRAAILLAQVLADSGDSPEIQEHLEDLETLAEDLAEERRQGRRLSRTASELFAQLRAGPSPASRREALKALVARDGTRSRAVVIAYQQPDPILRVLAVRAWPVRGESLDDLTNDIGILFADPDPRVRAAVSGLARSLPPGQAVVLMLAAMEKEQDGYAFRTMHADLGTVTKVQKHMAPGAEDDAEARARIVAKWRNDWHR